MYVFFLKIFLFSRQNILPKITNLGCSFAGGSHLSGATLHQCTLTFIPWAMEVVIISHTCAIYPYDYKPFRLQCLAVLPCAYRSINFHHAFSRIATTFWICYYSTCFWQLQQFTLQHSFALPCFATSQTNHFNILIWTWTEFCDHWYFLYACILEFINSLIEIESAQRHWCISLTIGISYEFWNSSPLGWKHQHSDIGLLAL